MKTLKNISLCLIALLFFQSSLVNADDLFSNSGNQNVFKNIQKQNSNPQGANNKITSTDLGDFVKAMGYEVKDLGDNFFLIKVSKGEWTFEPVISLSNAGTHLWVSINLKTYKSNADLNAEQYMHLLDANLTYGPVVFNFNKKSHRVSLTRSFLNQGILPNTLKSKIVDMCDVGVKTSKLWNIDVSKNTPVPQQVNKPSQPYWFGKNLSSNKKQQTNNPIGQWMSNKTNDELFGLQFYADGSYLYIYQKGQNQSETKGRYTIDGNNLLTLTSDKGEVLKGSLSWKSNNTFNFITQGADQGATGVQFNRVEKK